MILTKYGSVIAQEEEWKNILQNNIRCEINYDEYNLLHLILSNKEYSQKEYDQQIIIDGGN